MTIRDDSQIVSRSGATRQLTCVHCGSGFECALDGNCWCADEAVRLPMPVGGEDCLCPRCLREAARLQKNVGPQAKG